MPPGVYPGRFVSRETYYKLYNRIVRRGRTHFLL